MLLAFASYILLLVTAVVGCPIWSPPGAQINLEALLAAERDRRSILLNSAEIS